jgi:hypothetical protein
LRSTPGGEESRAPGEHEGARRVTGERLYGRGDLVQQGEVQRIGRRSIRAHHGDAVAVVAR